MKRKAKVYIVVRSLRFTAEEWAAVLAKLAGRKWSDFARAATLGVAMPEPTTRVRRRPMSAKDARLVLILAGIGNNLNQLARAANTAALRGQRIDLLARLIEIQRMVEGIIKLP